jgi:dolichol-phosphate mannosyltransferase
MLNESTTTDNILEPKAPQKPVILSIIVPTRNESKNVEPLLQRISSALGKLSFEVIFVDDSTDNTPEAIEKVKSQFPFGVQAIHRPLERRNGLGNAVVEGIKAAKSEWVCVMDGDLQHPPEVIPNLLETARTKQVDLVAASRLAEGGGVDGLSKSRELISRSLAFGSRVLFPRELANVTDPLTGFFVFRRSAVNADILEPKGFKILLEILVRCPKLKVTELPFKFAERNAEKSKANVNQVVALFEQLVGLRLKSYRYLAKFLTVGASGLLVNSFFEFLFTSVFGINYLVSAVYATQCSSVWNFVWTEKWVFSDRRADRQGYWQRLVAFIVVSNVSLLVRAPLLAFFVTSLGMHYLSANLLSLLVMTVIRFAISDRFIWTSIAKAKTVYYYNIHDILSIRSVQRLPELGYFRTEQVIDNPDFDVRVESNLSSFKQTNSVLYHEVFGRLGFDVLINRGENRTEVIASPLVGISPHVLYTNVVEPLLRWAFVRKGYALMHGACISFDGQALFITARTDTGKTTTILNLIRNNLQSINFLSDDMTIFSRSGEVMNYPKPLTISQHTVQAIGGAPLSKTERAFLKVQSRLHSREGRKFAMWLTEGRFPAATLNAVVQFVVPPPKYMVDRLVPGAQFQKRAQLALIAVIERGPDNVMDLDENKKVDTLLANAEDAYGFPPYPSIANALSNWNGEDLHQREREVVAAAINLLPAVQIASPRYDWYKTLPMRLKAIEPKPVVMRPAIQG